MKVAVIGYSGSGKSTLAGKLGKMYNCPVLYLDKVQFEAGWKERDEEEARLMVKRFLEENHNWVIDGNYTKFYREQRLEESDSIVFFDFSRWTCLYQAYRRFREHRGKTRESMAEGCEEKFDFEFIKWILHDGRTREKKKQYADTISRHGNKVIRLKNREDLELFLQKIN